MRKLKEILNINTQRYWDKKWKEKSLQKVSSDEALTNFLGYFEESGRILDFGCGLGGNIKKLSSILQGKEFILVDHSRFSLQFAKEELFGERDERGNSFQYFENLTEVADNSVDMIISIEVLEHITPYLEILDTLWGKLKQGGVLLISVPVKGIRDRNREHVNKFTLKSMFRILTNYSGVVTISPRSYSTRSGILATAYFLVEKKALAIPVRKP